MQRVGRAEQVEAVPRMVLAELGLTTALRGFRDGAYFGAKLARSWP